MRGTPERDGVDECRGDGQSDTTLRPGLSCGGLRYMVRQCSVAGLEAEAASICTKVALYSVCRVYSLRWLSGEGTSI